MKLQISAFPEIVAEEGGPYPCSVLVQNKTGKHVVQPDGSVDIDPREYTFKLAISLVVNGVEILADTGVIPCSAGQQVEWPFEFVPHASGPAVFTASLLDSHGNVIDSAPWDFEVIQGWWKDPIRASLVFTETWSN